MDISLGNLKILPAYEHTELLGAKVSETFPNTPWNDQIGVAEIDPLFSDTAAFCEFYGTLPDQAANCVILEAKRADKVWYAACLILGSTKADVNGLARRTLDARKVSFAPMNQAVELTQMEYGAITPIGLPGGWPILIDQMVIDTEFVIIGSGIRKSKLIVPGKLLASLPNVKVINGLAQAR